MDKSKYHNRLTDFIKKPLVLGSILVLTVLIFGGLIWANRGYLHKQPTIPPARTSTPTQEPTVYYPTVPPTIRPTSIPPLDNIPGWKTYVNPEAGIGFQYPSVWVFQDVSADYGLQDGELTEFYLYGKCVDPRGRIGVNPDTGISYDNKVLDVNVVYGNWELESFKKIQNAIQLSIDGRPAVRAGHSVWILNGKQFVTFGFLKGSEPYQDEILSKLRFIQ